MTTASIPESLVEMVRAAGDILLGYFGKVGNVRRKEHPSSVVCEADLAAEESIVRLVRARFPGDGILAEESGFQRGSSEYTWVIDPLDGTSNFVAGIPWFGTQVAVLRGSEVVAAAMFLPTEGALYTAEPGRGLWRNGQTVRVTAETDPRNVLCAFGLDPGAEAAGSRQNAQRLHQVLEGVRNIRATNSLVDFCYTMEGRLGACINLHTKIWDIAPAALMFPEARGKFTGLDGNPIAFDLREGVLERNYAVLGASLALHPRFVALLGDEPRA